MLRTAARFVRLGLLFRPEADQLPTRRGRWMLVVFGAAAHERIVVRHPGRIGDAGNDIRQVVMSVRGVVNRILAGARHAALETDDLRDAGGRASSA